LTTIIAKGAEATLIRTNWYDQDVVIKERISKTYRIPALDRYLRRTRTRQEARLLTEARNTGVRTPFVFLVDLNQTMLIMEFINGNLLKEILPTLTTTQRHKIVLTLGQHIATLHKHNIIHGDLTTSNIILTPDQELFFIDFGLGGISTEIEHKGVDIHLFQRTLESTHHSLYENCLTSFLEGYRSQFPESAKVIQRLWAIDSRGRYINRNKRLKTTKGE
jgi:Kae1-associated kinase Bud32